MSREGGFTAIHLYRETDHPVVGKFYGIVAEVVYWDAVGHYCLQTFDRYGVTLEIIELLMAEAKELIKYK